MTSLSHIAKRQRAWESNVSGPDTPYLLLVPLFHSLLECALKALEQSSERRKLLLALITVTTMPTLLRVIVDSPEEA